LVLTDHILGLNILSALKATDFSQEYIQELFACLKVFVQKYQKMPNVKSLRSMYKAYAISQGTTKTIVKSALSLLTALYDPEENQERFVSLDFLADKVQEVVKAIVLQRGLNEAIVLWDDGKFDSVLAQVQKAHNLSTLDKQKGTDVFLDAEARFEDEDVFDDSRVGTLIYRIDEILDGGLGAGELGVWLAPPNRGKSQMLVFNAIAAFLQGKNVFFASWEMSEKKLSSRIDSALLRMTRRNKLKDKKSAAKRLNEMQEKYGGEITVRRFGENSSVFDLRAAMDEYMLVSGKQIDIVIIDYADPIKPVTKVQEHRLQIDSVFQALHSTAQMYDLPIWTATQANREALSKKIVTMKDLADSFGKGKIADVIISIGQTPDEEEEGVVRLFFAKNREAKKHVSIIIQTAFEESRFISTFIEALLDGQDWKTAKELARDDADAVHYDAK